MTIPQYAENTTLVFWTGGWDSTYQMIQLLLVKRVPVTPIYLIDEDRRSTRVELLTMKRIREKLLEVDPKVKELLNPTWFFAASEVPYDKEIGDGFAEFRKTECIGTQYDWLAAFCKFQGIRRVQICAQADNVLLASAWYDYWDAYEKERESPSESSAERDPILDSPFKYFDMPVIRITKEDMLETVSKQGYLEIMKMTWFCHKPLKGKKPCGACHPCRQVIKEGLGWRIPAYSRIRGRIVCTLVGPVLRCAKKAFDVIVRKRSARADLAR